VHDAPHARRSTAGLLTHGKVAMGTNTRFVMVVNHGEHSGRLLDVVQDARVVKLVRVDSVSLPQQSGGIVDRHDLIERRPIPLWIPTRLRPVHEGQSVASRFEPVARSNTCRSTPPMKPSRGATRTITARPPGQRSEAAAKSSNTRVPPQ